MTPAENDAWIRGFATALAAAHRGGGETAAFTMRSANLTIADLRDAEVPESDIETIARAVRLTTI